MTTIKWMTALMLILVGGSVFATESGKSDVVLTSEQGCQIHYITNKNVDGWFIDGRSINCPDKWVNGYADITIFDAFRKPVEQIFGYFTNGFWVGSQPVPFPVVGLSEPDENIRSLEVEVGRNDEHDIQYVAQLRAEKMVDGSFGPFNACPIARILAVTDHREIFEDENIQSELLNEAIHYAKIVCPKVHQIHFYGSSISQPTDKEVFFFAEIDLEKRQIQVRRLPSSAEKRAEAERLSRIRVEPSGVQIMRVTPIRPVSMSSEQKDDHREEMAHQSEKMDEDVVEELPPSTEQVLEEKENPISVEKEPLLPINSDRKTEKTVTEQITEINAAIPVNLDKETEVLDVVPHLLTASRLLKKTVQGRAVVHVFRVDLSGQAWIDAPVPMKANGQLVQTGWNIVSGLFSAELPARGKSGGIPPLGTIVITDAIPCITEGCFAEPITGGAP